MNPKYIISIFRPTWGAAIVTCDDGVYSYKQLAEYTGMSQAGFRSRITKYEAVGDISNPEVLQHNSHPQERIEKVKAVWESRALSGPEMDEEKEEYGFDNRKCKRNSVLCEKYIECQNARLGISGVWVAPENTDDCYKELEVKRNLFRSSLNGSINIGIR